MDDWIKIAKDLEYREEVKKREEERKQRSRIPEILAAEKDWMERVVKRVQEIGDQGIRIRVERRPNGLELSSKGTVDIQFLGQMNFSIKYHNIFKPTNLLVNRPITVLHHRQVRVKELNAHNIEEILKFAALGMEVYTQVATHQRIEINLEEIIESLNLQEHIERKDHP